MIKLVNENLNDTSNLFNRKNFQGHITASGFIYCVSANKLLLLEHKSGVLSKVLNTVADDSGSIMTINQGIPLQGVANTTISIETKNLTIDLEALLDKLRMIDGVKRLEVLGQV